MLTRVASIAVLLGCVSSPAFAAPHQTLLQLADAYIGQQTSPAAPSSFEITVDTAIIRRSAAADAAVIGTVSKGTVLSIIETQGTWFKVVFFSPAGQRQEGFVAARLGKLKPGDAPPLTAVIAPVTRPPTPDRAQAPAQTAAPRIATANHEVEKQLWSMQLAAAHEDAKNAKRIMWAGIGVTGLSVFVKKFGDPGIADLGLLMGVGGAAVGVFKVTRAQQHIADLEQGGKAKGFALSIDMTRLAASYTVVF